ncbi:MAG: hypothetical protein AAF996_08325 [Pseudomonadota bacterium]
MNRLATQQTSSISPNQITVGVLALAVVLFVAIVAWPHDTHHAAPISAASPLAAKLDDPSTQKFLAVLHRVKPERSQALHREAEAAISNGATHEELAILVLAASDLDRPEDLEHLLRADVAHIDKLLRMVQTGATALSKQAPRYCRPATYDSFQNMDAGQVVDEVTHAFSYGSRGYDWLVRFNLLTLQAVEAGRDHPKSYGRMTRKDERAVQDMFLQLLPRQQFSELIKLQGASEAAQKRAIARMNMCDVVAETLLVLNRLPKDTRGRMIGELRRYAERQSFFKSRLGGL